MKYFYILKKDDGIVEVPYAEETYKQSLEQFLKGGNIVIRPKGFQVPMVVTSSKISEILPEDIYLSQMKNSRMKSYVYDGVWKDTKEHKVIFMEDWKKKEVESVKKLKEADSELSAEEQKRAKEKMKEVGDFLKSNVFSVNKRDVDN